MPVERAKVTTLEVCVKDAQDIRSWCLNFPIWTCDSGQIGWLVSKTVGVWLRPLKMVLQHLHKDVHQRDLKLRA